MGESSKETNTYKFKNLVADLKAEAKRFFKQGFNVVAIKYEEDKGGKVCKKPLCDWGKWHTQRQTLEEFESQNWGLADAFAIATDYPNNEGNYLAVIDFDTKGVSEEAKARGRELLAKFPSLEWRKPFRVACI